MWQKKKLQHKLKNYDPSKTEVYNMINNNIYPMYDCGKRFVYTN